MQEPAGAASLRYGGRCVTRPKATREGNPISPIMHPSRVESPYLSTNPKEPERSLITIRMMLVGDAAAIGYDVKEFNPESRGYPCHQV